MSKFNSKSDGTKTINRAGGVAYKQSPELELVSLLLASFVSEECYESSNDRIERLLGVADKIKDKVFLAQAAVYARTKFGMRSVSHIVAAYLAKHVKGKKWTKRAIEKTIIRPDDILEIMSFYFGHYGKRPIPNSLKKGLAWSLKKFDDYQLAKYRGENKETKMVDVINLVHYKGDANKAAIEKLMAGKLTSEEKTWESKLTRAGQTAENEEDKKKKKKEAWKSLVESRKIGYFALLRNLRNIVKDSPDAIDAACEMLTDERLIRKSLVLPFRYLTAYETLSSVGGANRVMSALDRAMEISLKNVPEFPGKTLVALDTSGSMVGKSFTIGSMFAAALIKTNPGARLRTFNTSHKDVSVAPDAPVSAIARGLGIPCGGTDFDAIFSGMNEMFDRIIILSDMQGWAEGRSGSSFSLRAIGTGSVNATFKEYCKKTGCKPKLYSFDLAGYGDMKFPENDVYCLSGFSEKVFSLMKLLEEDRDAMINEIKKIKI